MIHLFTSYTLKLYLYFFNLKIIWLQMITFLRTRPTDFSLATSVCSSNSVSDMRVFSKLRLKSEMGNVNIAIEKLKREQTDPAAYI